MKPKDINAAPDAVRSQLSAEDRAILEVVEKAQEQYRSYLAAAEVGSFARLTTPRPGEQPPRTDLPLTLIVG